MEFDNLRFSKADVVQLTMNFDSMSLVKIGGVCALLAALSALVAFVTDPFSASDDQITDWFSSVNDGRELFLAMMLVAVFGLVLAGVAGLGFFRALLQADGDVVWIALATWSLGMLILVLVLVADSGLGAFLAPRYADADAAAKPNLEAIAAAVSETGHLMRHIGAFIAIGVGMALFSYSSIRLSFGPRWVGFLGLGASFLEGWVMQLDHVADVFGILAVVGFLMSQLWLVLMGLIMLRRGAAAVSA